MVVDMSSIAPLASKEVASALAKKGVEMIDAPVSGGEPKAIDGTLAIMVGGKAEIFEKVQEPSGSSSAVV
jgi:2-hydroxy-3-oxopropionate reductase